MTAQLEVIYAQAYALYQGNRPLDAANIFSTLCASDPFDFRYWSGLAASLQEGKNYAKAMHAWAMAALIEPGDPFPHFYAANCACSLGEMREALLALEEAKSRLPDSNHRLSGPIETLLERWKNL